MRTDQTVATTPTPWRNWLLLAVGFVLTVTSVVWYFAHREFQDSTKYWQERLETAALTRRDMLGDWWSERFGDIAIIATDRQVREVFTKGATVTARARLEEFAAAYGYANIALFDSAGTTVAALRDGALPLPAVLRTALQQDRPIVHLTSSDVDSVLVEVILRVGTGREATGIIVLTSDPSATLFPLIVQELAGTVTGQTLLVERNGETVRVFSPQRFPAPRTYSVASPRLSVASALHVDVQFGKFLDGRSTAVLASFILDSVSGWGLVREVSAREAYQSAWATTRTYVVLGLLTILVGLVAMRRVWRTSQAQQRATAHASMQHRDEFDRRVLAEAQGRRLASMLNNSIEEAYVFGGETLLFQLVNNTAIKHLQYSEQELLRRGPFDIAPSLNPEAFRSELKRLQGSLGPDITFEWEQARRDGTRYPVEAIVHLQRDTPTPTFFMLVRDISERRHLEQQLRESQKLEAVGRLAGGVAHDFNNILTAIVVSAELARPDAAGNVNVLAEIDEILKASDRAKSLTMQLLAFGRRQIMRTELVSLSAVINGLETMLRRLTPEHIDMYVVLGAKGLVNADVGMLEQVATNLVVNATQAMPNGGRLTVETSDVVIDTEYARKRPVVNPGQYILLTVSDTGVGMSEETKARLFEPFFTTKPEGRGTGLGLSVVHGIVNQFGGHVWVYSEPGQGTTFKVYLPSVIGEASVVVENRATPPASVPAVVPETRTILLVEDDAIVRRVTARILEGAGFAVLQAEHGELAMSVAREHSGPVHLLITDIVMPRMGGRALAERLAISRPGMPVLYLSGFTDNAVVHHGILDKDVNFMQKPYLSKALLAEVYRILDTTT